MQAADFDAVFRQGHRSADHIFTILYRPNGLGYPRLGLAIAKKRVRRAVDRNRLKRLIRESFRAARLDLQSVDCVVLARDASATTSNEAIFSSLQRHWQSLGKQAPRSTEKPVLN